jgi:uncharacterized membrane protein YraQ (UPF0718 family)
MFDPFIPVQWFSDWITYTVLNLVKDSNLASALNFFIYDSIKVTLLLIVIVFIVGLVRTFITPQKVKKIIGKNKEGFGNVLAALLGIPTPFCSCSAVPLFIGFVESGIPLGITFSFLIASPLINEVAIAMLFAMFGWEIALLYVVSGLFVAIIAGIVIGRMNLENELESFVHKMHVVNSKEKKMDWNQRINFGLKESKSIALKVLPYLLLGIAIGGIIHGYAPSDLLIQIAGENNLFAVPIAVLIGIPLYSNAAGMVPIVGALIAKGLPIGTALAFMMSVIGLSLPEMIILRKVLKLKLLLIFALTLFISFTILGYLFNFLLH